MLRHGVVVCVIALAVMVVLGVVVSFKSIGTQLSRRELQIIGEYSYAPGLSNSTLILSSNHRFQYQLHYCLGDSEPIHGTWSLRGNRVVFTAPGDLSEAIVVDVQGHQILVLPEHEDQYMAFGILAGNYMYRDKSAEPIAAIVDRNFEALERKLEARDPETVEVLFRHISDPETGQLR